MGSLGVIGGTLGSGLRTVERVGELLVVTDPSGGTGLVRSGLWSEVAASGVSSLTNLEPNGLLTGTLQASGLPSPYTKSGTWTATEVADTSRNGRVIRATAGGGNVGISKPAAAITEGHLYYTSIWVRVTSTAAQAIEAAFFTGAAISYVAVAGSGEWQLVSAITEAAATGSLTVTTTFTSGATAIAEGTVLDIAELVRVDLTDVFGAGFEPSIAEMDAVVTAAGGWATTLDPADLAPSGVTLPSPAQRVEDGILRVGAWNTQGYYSNTGTFGAYHIMSGMDADVWALSEAYDVTDASDIRGAAHTMSRFPYRRFDTITPDYPNADWDKGRFTLSLTPMRSTSWSATPSQGLQRSEIRRWGQTIAVYAAHLPASASMETQTGYMQAHADVINADETPLKIFAGDWNTPNTGDVGPPVDDTALGPLTSTGWTHLQTLLGWQNTVDLNDTTTAYIDNIAVSSGLTIVAGGVGTYPVARSSDHLPVWADVSLAE